MKKTSINNWPGYFLGICAVSGMLLFTACGEGEKRNNEGAEYGMGADPDSPGTVGVSEGNEYDRTSNTYVAQRNYDVNTMGTAMKNRKEMEATGKDLSNQDYEKLRQEYDNLNNELRQSYRQSPGLSMRYTDDYRTADVNYDYYGVYYDNLNNEQARNSIKELEQKRSDLKNQMRGKIDPKSNAYIAAEMDAVPKEGFDQLYQHLQQQTSSNQQSQQNQTRMQQQGQQEQDASLSGTVFVEFVVDKKGNVTSPKAVETLESQPNTGSMSGDNTNTAIPTGTGTSGEGTTEEGTNTGMTPNTTGTVGSGNSAGSSGTSTGTTGNATADEHSQSVQPEAGTSTQNSQSGNTENAKQLEQKAIEAIKSTSGMWEPAQMDGQPVASLVQIPVPINMNTMGSGANSEQGNINQSRQNQQNNSNHTGPNRSSTTTGSNTESNNNNSGGSPESNTEGDK
ncbi:MAG: hypothetical protein KY428_04060 [Bacteroidetes bacterium]|nr:hypothetical protein [Bacteroidota bacterium]